MNFIRWFINKYSVHHHNYTHHYERWINMPVKVPTINEGAGLYDQQCSSYVIIVDRRFACVLIKKPDFHTFCYLSFIFLSPSLPYVTQIDVTLLRAVDVRNRVHRKKHLFIKIVDTKKNLRAKHV